MICLFGLFVTAYLNMCDPTTVCNVKVKYIRPQYHTLKEWMDDDSNVYIGRAGVVFVDGTRFPPTSSEWANPFKIGKHGDRDNVLRLYRNYIKEKQHTDENFIEKLRALKGKQLGCWCVNCPTSLSMQNDNTNIVCHGQILLELIHTIE